MTITISHYLAEVLKSTQSDTIFGIPSYVGMRMLRALKKLGFRMILNSHEQNAVHAAEGYFYATSKLGIVAIAMGPGLTNALTGIADAYIESVPLLVLAARPYAASLGKNEYHANSGIGRTLNEAQLIGSCTKAHFVVDSAANAVTYINDAIKTALTGRPGPVYLVIPPELQEVDIEVAKVPTLGELLAVNKQIPEESVLKEFVQLFTQAKKPLIVIGKNCVSNRVLLNEVLMNNAPYFTTYGAKGKVPVYDNYLGTSWYSNSAHIAKACEEADVIFAFGEDFTAFSARGFRSFVTGKLVQIHPHVEEIGRSFAPMKGYCGEVLPFFESIKNVKKPWGSVPQKTVVNSVTQEYLHAMTVIKSPITYFADVGNVGYAAISDLVLAEGQEFYTSGKNGVCGFSIPAAVGYSFASQERPVISISGDLSFLMNMQETVNAKKLGTKNSFFVFNNHTPQNISADQIDEINEEVQCDMPTLDFAGAAQFAGLKYEKFETPEAFKEWLQTVDLMAENYLVELLLPREDRPLSGD